MSVDREFGNQKDVEHILKYFGQEEAPTPTDVPVSVVDPNRYSYSQRDLNVFDGMNQARALARGDWILYLNAGDRLAKGFGSELLQALQQSANFDYLYADGVTVDALDGRQFLRSTPKELKLEHYLARAAVLHPSLIVRKSILDEHPFNIHLDLAADYELMLWLIHSRKKGKRIPHVGSLVYSGGLSHQYRLRARRQALSALFQYAPNNAFRRKARWIFFKQALMHLTFAHRITRQGLLGARLRPNTGAHPPETWT